MLTGCELIDLKRYTQMADFGDFRFPYRFEKLYSVESDSLIDLRLKTETACLEGDGDPSKNRNKNVSTPGFEPTYNA